MPSCKYCTWTMFNRAHFLYTLTTCCCHLQHMTESLSHTPPLLRWTLCHTIHMYTVISYFPILWAVESYLTRLQYNCHETRYGRWMTSWWEKSLVINFFTLHTYHYLMYNKGFYPRFYQSKWSPNNHNFFSLHLLQATTVGNP